MTATTPPDLGSRTGWLPGLARVLVRREAVVVALAAIPRLVTAYCDHGIFWPDEIYQSLEPAHRLAFGYGITAWEFRDGARSWLFPTVLAAVMKLGALLGARSGLALVGVTKTFMVLLGLAGVLCAMRLAHRLAGDTAALLAGVLAAAFPPALVFGSRAMSEMASATAIVAAAWLTLDPRGARSWLAGAVASAAIYFRYQNGLVAVALLALLVAQRRWASAAHYAAAACVVGLLGGLLDYFTWGRLFHSFLVYWKFNFVQGNAARWGASPWSFYFDVAWSSTGPLILVVALGLLLAIPRASGLLLVGTAFVLAHCLTPHKEFRFIMPIAPLVLALAATGLGVGLDRIDRRRITPWALGAILAFGLLARTRAMTFDQMGQFGDSPAWGRLPPWNFFGGLNRALAEAGARSDVCGVTVVAVAPWWTGGFSYLHRDVPLFTRAAPAAIAASNYLVTPRTGPSPPGYDPVASYLDHRLLRRAGACAPPPAGYRRTLE